MHTLIREIKQEAACYGEYSVCTVFIGGGTPTVVEPAFIAELLSCLRQNYTVETDAEITIEMNPGTVAEEGMEIYRRAGINRISIGMQTADDGELRLLGRIHTHAAFLEAYRLSVAAGFTNINVDIMSALPGQSEGSYLTTLEKVMSLSPRPAHISAYSLIVEEGTPFYDQREKGELPLPSEEEERAMYEKTGEILQEYGYRRYEISNYALEGHECRHNCVYWRRGNYVGFGLGASSMVENARFRNEDRLEEYMARINRGKRADRTQKLSLQERMEEFMFLGLRLTDGIREEEFLREFRQSLDDVYGKVIKKHLENGLLERSGTLRLTGKGLDVSNYVMADFLL